MVQALSVDTNEEMRTVCFRQPGRQLKRRRVGSRVQ